MLGCFLDGISMVVLTMGVILPTVEKAGIDLLWFGIFIVLVVEMAQITPPVGFNLFVLQGMTEQADHVDRAAGAADVLLMIVAVLADLVLPGARHVAAAADEDGMTSAPSDAASRVPTTPRSCARRSRVLGIRTDGRRGHRHRLPAARRARAGARRRGRRARRRASSSATSPIREFRFTLPLAPRGTPFQRRVWDAIAAIPLGESRTYGEIARTVRTRAARGRPGVRRQSDRARHAVPSRRRQPAARSAAS